MLAVRSNERAASAAGIDVARVKLQVFAVSSFIAGLGGCLIAYRFGSVSESSFGTIASLTALAIAYLGGITCVSGAVTAGLLATSGVAFYGITQAIGSVGQWEALIGGVLLIVMAVANPEGIAGGIRTRFAKRTAEPRASSDVGRRGGLMPLLEARSLSVTYGGVRANDSIDLDCAAGTLVGLIGPNGAGKTTFIDAITGFTPISTGSITFDGNDITNAGPSARARSGPHAHLSISRAVRGSHHPRQSARGSRATGLVFAAR